MPELRLLNMAILFVFCLGSTLVAFQSLLLSSSIDVNKIIGAICVYLLLALDWSFLYLFINMAIPDSFHGLSSTDIGVQLPELVYYSFVTITTLGYGDITPDQAPRPYRRLSRGVCGTILCGSVGGMACRNVSCPKRPKPPNSHRAGLNLVLPLRSAVS